MNNAACYTRRALELRAAEYYASIRKPEKEWKALEDLAPQLAEFEHRICAQDYDSANLLLKAIGINYLCAWGHYARLAELYERLLMNLSENHPSKCALLGDLGSTYYEMGQFHKAIGHCESALKIVTEQGDAAQQHHYMGVLGRVYSNSGQHERAIDLYQRAVTLAHKLGDYRNVGTYLGRLSVAYRRSGQVRQAIALYEEALPLLREGGNRTEYERHLGDLGSAYRDLGQFEKALQYHQETLAIARAIGYRRDEGIWLNSLGLDHYGLGHWQQAIDFYRQARAILSEIGDQRNHCVCLHRLGVTYWALGEVEQAIGYCTEALSLAETMVYQPGAFDCHVSLSRMLLSRRQLSAASQHSDAATNLHVPKTYYLAPLACGIVRLYQGYTSAEQAFTDAVRLCQEAIGRTIDLYQPHYALALALVGRAVCDSHWIDLAQRTDLLTPALAEYRRALAITAAPGVVRDALRDLELIRAAGIEGLEPAFALLEQAIADWQLLPGDALPSPTS